MSKQIETLRSMLNGVANALRAEMKKLNERLDEQEERLNGHETRISALEGRADEHEGRISALEGRVDKHEGRISALEARVAELERRFAGQGGRMNDQQMRIDNQEAVLLRMSNCANRGMIYAPGVSGTGRDGCATTLGELRAPDHLKGLR